MKLLLLLVICLAGAAAPDGKFYAKESFVKEKIPVNEPYQRAILTFRNGEEFLMIQPIVVGQGKEFGWIVPCPAEPIVGYMDSVQAERQFLHLDRISTANVSHMSKILGICGLLLLLISLAVLAVRSWWRHKDMSLNISPLSATVLISAFVLLIILGIAIPGTLSASRGADIQILSTHRVGLYDVAVVKAKEPSALREWLNKNSFNFSAKDEKAFQAYIDKGWVFVMARVSLQETEKKDITTVEGLVQPLALLFKTAEPVYPFALTATAETPTEVLLYVMADQRVGHAAMETEYADKKNVEFFPEYKITWSSDKSQAQIPTADFITKLRGTLSSATVREDLVLHFDQSNQPFRKHIWKW